MADRVTLDPSEVSTSTRSSLDISDFISVDGIDWGNAQMVDYVAAQAVGSSPVDYVIPNRSISIPLRLKTTGGTTFDTIRTAIQAKVGLWQGQGGWLKRVTTGGTVFADVVKAELHLGGDWLQSQRDVDVNAVLTLEAIPDFYEAEETLSDHTETTLPEITFTETTANGGDFPLGDRVRIVVDEDQAQNQRGMFWSWRGRHYSSASTAASAYEAEALQALDTATKVAKGGASGGTVVTHGTLSTNWTPVVGTNIGGSTYLTHTGTNRIYARVFSASGTLVASRFVWDVGDLVLPSENDAVRCYDGGTFHVLDLGEVRLDPTPTGTHRWQGMIQAKGDVGGEAFSVDRVWIANQDESAGVLRAPWTFPLGLSTYSARSGFDTESGVITGDSLQVGGAWTVVTNSDADDFSASGGVATRVSTSDTGTVSGFAGRAVTAGATNYAAIAATLDFKMSTIAAASEVDQGLVARVVDNANYLMVRVLATSSVVTLSSFYMLGGSRSAFYNLTVPGFVADTYYTLRILVDAQGNLVAQVLPQGGATPLAQVAFYDSVLATGGTLASGRIGICDLNLAATACTRTYDNFAAWVPSPDAVAFASQSCELGTQGIIREDSGGTAYGPISTQYGDIPRMPNRSSAGTVEFMAKMSRGDLMTLPDPGIDDSSARVTRRASHLLIPS